jgi:GAF domain-containing protein
MTDRHSDPLVSMTVKSIESDTLTYLGWREAFTKALLRGGAVFGILVALTLSDFTNASRSAIYFVAYMLILSAAFTPVPYWVQAAATSLVFLGLGVFKLLDSGIYSDANLFFLTFAAMVLLLYNRRMGIGAAILSTLFMTVMGMLTVSGGYHLQATPDLVGSGRDWFGYILGFVAMAAVVLLGLNLLIREFDSLLDRVKATITALLKDRSNLENEIILRTRALDRKSSQLQSAAHIARQVAMIQEIKKLLEEVVKLICEQFDYYYTGIYFLDTKSEYIVLQAGTGELGEKLLENGHKLPISSGGVVNYLVINKRPRLINNPRDIISAENEEFPLTRSRMMVPLLVRDEVIGILDLHSTDPDGFKADDPETLQTIADQLAVTIDNARLLSESRLIIQQLEAISSERTRWAWTDYLRKQQKGYEYTLLGVKPIIGNGKARETKTEKDTHGKLEIPVSLRGQQIGKIVLTRKGQQSKWTDKERELADEISSQVGLALENARLFDETSRRAERERMVVEITSKIRSTTDPQAMIQTALDELKDALGVTNVELIPHKASSSLQNQ